ncbi:MAG: hypothetical protein KAV00_10100 [Phycisphaerae bacterium]|nr:hypothetical protein [Phycisphaerae bacterium]
MTDLDNASKWYLPIGVILPYWGKRENLKATGWAICDGDYPEPGWHERTPNLIGKVLVGAEKDPTVSVQPAEKIMIEKHDHALTPSGDAEMSCGLRGPNVEWHHHPEGGKFFERVYPRTDEQEATEIEISAKNLPRGEVYFVIRYK